MAELKKNKKSDEYGFIPKSWKLVRLEPVEKDNFEAFREYELAGGVADYFFTEENGENTLIYTTGRHVFEIKDLGEGGRRKKLFNTEFCLKVGGLCQKPKKEEIFDDELFSSI